MSSSTGYIIFLTIGERKKMDSNVSRAGSALNSVTRIVTEKKMAKETDIVKIQRLM